MIYFIPLFSIVLNFLLCDLSQAYNGHVTVTRAQHQAFQEILQEELAFAGQHLNNYQLQVRSMQNVSDNQAPSAIPLQMRTTMNGNIAFINRIYQKTDETLQICGHYQFVSNYQHKMRACFRHYFIPFFKRSYKLNMIDRTIYKLARRYILTSAYEQNRSFETNDLNTFYSYSIPEYLYRKNQYQWIWDDEKKLALPRKYYKRKIKRLGRIPIEQYLILNFNRTQLLVMGSLIRKTVEQFHSHQAYATLILKKDEIEYERELLQQQLDQAVFSHQQALFFGDGHKSIDKITSHILELSSQIAQIDEQTLPQQNTSMIMNQLSTLEQQRRELIASIAQQTSPQELPHLIAQMQDIMKQIEQWQGYKSERIDEIDFSYRDIRSLALRHLHIEHQKAMLSGPLQDKSSQNGDLVMAAYLTKQVDPEVIEKLLAMDVLQEGWISRTRRAGQIALSAGRAVLLLTPTTAVYTSLAFIIYDSVKNNKVFQRTMVDDSHYF